MQYKAKDKKRILITGIFIAFILLVGSLSIMLLSKENSLFESKVVIKTMVKNAQNIRAGSSVKLKGIKVGTVSHVEIQGIDKIILDLSIIKNYINWIKKDSKIEFKTQGVLGDRFLEIVGGSEDIGHVESNDYLEIDESSQFDRFIDKGEDILVVGSRVLQRFDQLLEKIDQNNVSGMFSNLNRLTNKTANIAEAINEKDLKTTIKNMNSSMKRMDRILGQIENGPGSLNSLLYDRSVHDDLKEILGGTKRSNVLRFFIREQIKNK